MSTGRGAWKPWRFFGPRTAISSFARAIAVGWSIGTIRFATASASERSHSTGLCLGDLRASADDLPCVEAPDEVGRYLERLTDRRQLGAIPRNAHFPLMPHVRTV